MSARVAVGVVLTMIGDGIVIWWLRGVIVSRLAFETAAVGVVGGSILIWWLLDIQRDTRRFTPEPEAEPDGED